MKTLTQIKERSCASDPIKSVCFGVTVALLVCQFVLIFIFDIT